MAKALPLSINIAEMNECSQCNGRLTRLILMNRFLATQKREFDTCGINGQWNLRIGFQSCSRGSLKCLASWDLDAHCQQGHRSCIFFIAWLRLESTLRRFKLLGCPPLCSGHCANPITSSSSHAPQNEKHVASQYDFDFALPVPILPPLFRCNCWLQLQSYWFRSTSLHVWNSVQFSRQLFLRSI